MNGTLEFIIRIVEILVGVLVGGFFFKVIDRIRYKQQDKKLKKDEVDKAEVETDKKQIDLGDLFLEKSQKWAEIMETNTERMIKKMDENDAKRDEDWKEMKKDMEYVKSEVSSISEYLNGDYQKFKSNGGKRGKRK